MNTRYALDIETAALPRDVLDPLKPTFTAPGNYKDAVKIAENIAEQERRWYATAALSPLTGRVLVIGLKPFRRAPVFFEGDEADILRLFWAHVVPVPSDVTDQFYGHALHGFDLPFLIKRSWLHGITFPFRAVMGDRGYIDSRRFIDTMTSFACGDRTAGYIGLDALARFFGMPGKTEDLGPTFGDVYATDKPRALAYLARDLELVEGVAARMFPVPPS